MNYRHWQTNNGHWNYEELRPILSAPQVIVIQDFLKISETIGDGYFDLERTQEALKICCGSDD